MIFFVSRRAEIYLLGGNIMKLSALMADYTPSAEFAGVATNDDFVLAVDIAEE